MVSYWRCSGASFVTHLGNLNPRAEIGVSTLLDVVQGSNKLSLILRGSNEHLGTARGEQISQQLSERRVSPLTAPGFVQA